MTGPESDRRTVEDALCTAERCGLNAFQASALLNLMMSEYMDWERFHLAPAKPSAETIRQSDLLIEIVKLLGRKAKRTWFVRKNRKAPFGGESPIVYMYEKGISGFEAVREELSKLAGSVPRSSSRGRKSGRKNRN